MDLEQLTKHQIILLTLLVSLVTSIATGIVTVSLMSQTSPSVTRTINQIVEKTVQTVTPGGPATITQRTIVVKDDELAAQSIASLQKSVIRITAKGGNDLIARGVIIDTKGIALTDKAALLNSDADAFDAILPGGKRVGLTVGKAIATSSPILAVTLTLGTSTQVAAAPLGDISKVKLGQGVLRIAGTGIDVVGEGIIAMLPSTQTDVVGASVESITPGSILATRFGEVIGMTTAASKESGVSFYSTISFSETSTKLKP